MDPCIKFHSLEDRNRLLGRRRQKKSTALLAAWNDLINEAKNEQVVQSFLERHPALLPGLLDFHNGPLHGIIVSKFPFGADFVSDFAFVTRTSMALQFTFVEIEDPTKHVFNKNGTFTQDFNQARQQIADWKVWVEKNTDALMQMFSPMFETYNAWNDYKKFRFYLIYGRRAEVESSKKLKNRWSSILAISEDKTIVLTYDRLGYYEELRHDLIVCTYQNQEFYAKPDLI